MRAKLAIWIALGAWLLIGPGCSSVASRTKPRQTKFYPGVRNFNPGGERPGGDPAAGMLATVDLALSAATDTLLLPIDALYQPKGTGKYTEGTYAGLYRFGFERSDFRLLGARERWWLTGTIEEVTRRMGRSPADKPPELSNPVFLVVEGELSEPGRYGHMGAYRRELRVTTVLELQQMSPDAER